MQTMEGRQYNQNVEKGNNKSSSSSSYSTAVVPHSPWQSPVPYLFGGLAAMLGIIAFALLILACSYWNLSGTSQRDVETGDDDAKPDGDTQKTKPLTPSEKFLVIIMAGDVKPTYLATPANRSYQSCTCTCVDHKEEDRVLPELKQTNNQSIRILNC